MVKACVTTDQSEPWFKPVKEQNLTSVLNNISFKKFQMCELFIFLNARICIKQYDSFQMRPSLSDSVTKSVTQKPSVF